MGFQSQVDMLIMLYIKPLNEQPPQIPNTAHFGVMRLGEASNTSLTCASSNLAREKHRSAITVSNDFNFKNFWSTSGDFSDWLKKNGISASIECNYKV
jgi:hypothetical protein